MCLLNEQTSARDTGPCGQLSARHSKINRLGDTWVHPCRFSRSGRATATLFPIRISKQDVRQDYLAWENLKTNKQQRSMVFVPDG